jgi:hypothetical protein
MPGNASSCAADAVSTSIFAGGSADRGAALGTPDGAMASRPGIVSEGNRCRPRGFVVFDLLARRAESTAASWPSKARALDSGTLSIVPTARSARTDAPNKATLERKSRAFFSAGVGMGPRYSIDTAVVLPKHCRHNPDSLPSRGAKQLFAVILRSEATKDLHFAKQMQILRCAQDDR